MTEHSWMAHGVLGALLDTAILTGILFTAVLTVFKAGRWFGGIMDSINHLSNSMDSFKAAFDRHTVDEENRFSSIEATMKKHSDRITELRESIKVLSQETGKIQ